MTELEIQRKLRTTNFGKTLFLYDSVDSTNDIAKNIYRTAAEGTVIVAEEQTSGRGRLGRKWHSTRGESLTFSIILRPDIQQPFLGILSLYAGLAVAETIEELLGIPPECKWPNDILIEGKKCCGILSESSFVNDRCAGIIIGIGINVNQQEFPPEISSTAVSLLQIAKAQYANDAVLSTLLFRMEQLYPLVQHHRYGQLCEGWLRYAKMMGKVVTITQSQGSHQGIAKRIEENGELVLLCNGEEKRFSSGDLTLRNQA
jgi:BirA family biotin operon repressor/biotin-[acetyl-CoA-carboxylase] ligase